MQESMEDAIAAESEFHRYNSENHRLVNQNLSKNRPETKQKNNGPRPRVGVLLTPSALRVSYVCTLFDNKN